MINNFILELKHYRFDEEPTSHAIAFQCDLLKDNVEQELDNALYTLKEHIKETISSALSPE